jgi:hypothetical protein
MSYFRLNFDEKQRVITIPNMRIAYFPSSRNLRFNKGENCRLDIE